MNLSDSTLEAIAALNSLTVSLAVLTTAWPFMWPDALTRVFAAFSNHGSVITLLDALTGTLWTLTAWAWGDAPLLVATSGFAALLAAWAGWRAVDDHVTRLLVRAIVRIDGRTVPPIQLDDDGRA